MVSFIAFGKITFRNIGCYMILIAIDIIKNSSLQTLLKLSLDSSLLAYIRALSGFKHLLFFKM